MRILAIGDVTSPAGLYVIFLNKNLSSIYSLHEEIYQSPQVSSMDLQKEISPQTFLFHISNIQLLQSSQHYQLYTI